LEGYWGNSRIGEISGGPSVGGALMGNIEGILALEEHEGGSSHWRNLGGIPAMEEYWRNPRLAERLEESSR
jgi:hypothetical protein